MILQGLGFGAYFLYVGLGAIEPERRKTPPFWLDVSKKCVRLTKNVFVQLTNHFWYSGHRTFSALIGSSDDAP